MEAPSVPASVPTSDADDCVRHVLCVEGVSRFDDRGREYDNESSSKRFPGLRQRPRSPTSPPLQHYWVHSFIMLLEYGDCTAISTEVLMKRSTLPVVFLKSAPID